MSVLAFLAGCGGGAEGAPTRTLTIAPPIPVVASASSSTHAACPAGLIEGTDVCDTPDAREAIGVCEAYRRALEARDATSLLELASLEYFDDGGTPEDAADDTDRQGLEQSIHRELQAAEAIRYEIHYRTVRSGARVRVTYSYAASYRVGTQWSRKVDDSTLVLRREKGVLKIVSGM